MMTGSFLALPPDAAASPWLLPVLPFIAALLSALLPGWQPAAWIGLAAAGGTLTLAVHAMAADSGDPAHIIAALVALIATAASLGWLGWCADEIATGRETTQRLKTVAAGQQAMLAAALLGLSPSPWSGWLGIAGAMGILTLLTIRAPHPVQESAEERTRRGDILAIGMMACLISLLGLAALQGMAGTDDPFGQASWKGLAASIGQGGQGSGHTAILGLTCLAAGLLVPTGIAPVHQWFRTAAHSLPPPAQLLAAASLPPAALLFLLRLKALGLPASLPDSIGLLSVLTGAAMTITAGNGQGWRWSGPLACLSGACLAGNAGAGLLYLSLGLLALSACQQLDGRAAQTGAAADHGPSPEGHRLLDALRLTARLSLGGLPGGTLAGMIALIGGTAASRPAAALLLAFGLGLGSFALLRQAPLLRHMQRPPPPARSPLPLDITATLPAMILLLIAALLGLTAPSLGWFAAAAKALP